MITRRMFLRVLFRMTFVLTAGNKLVLTTTTGIARGRGNGIGTAAWRSAAHFLDVGAQTAIFAAFALLLGIPFSYLKLIPTSLWVIVRP